MNYAIEVKNFTKRYDSKGAVSGAIFQIKPSSIHGLIGPNGAGKSTTLSSLMSLVVPTKGELFIESKKVIENPYFNQNVGFVPAEPNFAKNLTVERYVKLCGMLRDVPEAEIEKKLHLSPLNNYRRRLCRDLSTGWKKILLVFVSFNLYRPKILILDEVRNGLDPTAWFQLTENLKKLKAEGGTILLSTHILSDLQELADDITMIDNGKIVYSGKKDTNLEELYKKLIIQQEAKEGKKTTYF